MVTGSLSPDPPWGASRGGERYSWAGQGPRFSVRPPHDLGTGMVEGVLGMGSETGAMSGTGLMASASVDYAVIEGGGVVYEMYGPQGRARPT